MEKLNEVRQWLCDEGVYLFDRQLPFHNDTSHAVTIRLRGNVWGIFLDGDRLTTTAQEKSAALHEAGHYATGTTHALDSPFDLVAKHEHKADKWAVQRALSAEELDEAVASGCTELWELAEHFNVTEEFMKKAVCWYTHGNLSADLYF